MANVLGSDKQIAIISALAEGSSIRSIERITGVHRDTIMRLGVRVGKGCASLLDSKMRNLSCKQLQFDELWGFIGKKEKRVRPEDDQNLGDCYTFVAIERHSKLVLNIAMGKRDQSTTLFGQKFASSCCFQCAQRNSTGLSSGAYPGSCSIWMAPLVEST